MAVYVRGLADLMKTFKYAPRDVRLAYRAELRTIATPVKETAESLAATRISGLAAGEPWTKMRIGVTQKLVYVAPKKKGVRGRTPAKRPNFANLLATRALDPALEQNEQRVVRDLEQMMDKLAGKWNRG
jgi:hypothetical protein